MAALSPIASFPPPLRLGGAEFVADPSGALWWPDERTLVVADLHFEKGTSFAAKGLPLPPYDTRATLAALAAAIARLAPERVVALGDSFHDGNAAERLDPADQAVLEALVARQDWLWLAGNHDPSPPAGLGGRVLHDRLLVGEVELRHEAVLLPDVPEISGHYHPKASLRVHGRRVTCRCFLADATRIMLPAFGAYAGGLDVGEPALRRLFPDGFTALLLGSARVTAVPSAVLLGTAADRPRP